LKQNQRAFIFCVETALFRFEFSKIFTQTDNIFFEGDIIRIEGGNPEQPFDGASFCDSKTRF